MNLDSSPLYGFLLSFSPWPFLLFCLLYSTYLVNQWLFALFLVCYSFLLFAAFVCWRLLSSAWCCRGTREAFCPLDGLWWSTSISEWVLISATDIWQLGCVTKLTASGLQLAGFLNTRGKDPNVERNTTEKTLKVKEKKGFEKSLTQRSLKYIV